MILDGFSYYAFIQFCRVILSRMVNPYCLQSSIRPFFTGLQSDLLLVFSDPSTVSRRL